MTLPVCDLVAERVALGEPLGELAGHAETCARCAGLVAMSGKLAAAHHAVDPGLGFSARMTVGAQHRIAVRRRRRIAGGLAASVAGGMFGVFLVTRSPAPAPAVSVPTPEREPETPDHLDDADADAFAGLIDTDASARVSADWGHIKKPLAPYKKLIEKVEP